MNWAHFKDPVSNMHLAGTGPLTHEVAGWQVQVRLL